MDELIVHIRAWYETWKDKIRVTWARSKWWYIGLALILLGVCLYTAIYPYQSMAGREAMSILDQGGLDIDQDFQEENTSYHKEPKDKSQNMDRSLEHDVSLDQDVTLLLGVAPVEKPYPLASIFGDENSFKAAMNLDPKKVDQAQVSGDKKVDARRGDLAKGLAPSAESGSEDYFLQSPLVHKPQNGLSRPRVQEDALSTKSCPEPAQVTLRGLIGGSDPQALIDYGGQSYCLSLGERQGGLVLEAIKDQRALVSIGGDSQWHSL
jgi:hypothetical protein